MDQRRGHAWQDGTPADEEIGNQTLDRAASQGSIAGFRLDEEGIHPFVTHDVTNTAEGAVGLLAPSTPRAR